ncbi:tRNA/rRNA methyltransferase [Nitrosomonas sp. PY1]|uniref:RNA methyltransferase n=1 Tax=Nitrosomonas sp. PY1 TaxID=1803906 RepID=UPI001FC8301A|nr:RNA methyltransferase [Nitrosomonas sp. PY1]GKS70230.1 tRNA/rRNA methyltransferase [Nitrosomonas sp. PY1]
MTTLDFIRIVLSHTSHPGNIGATARAMKTMGLHALYLVNPRHFPNEEANARASNAMDILQHAITCESLDQSLIGTVFTAAVTARPRGLSHEVFDARQGAKELLRYALQQQPVALLFGRENSGLTTEDVSKCQIIIRIPSDPDYSSLNLASAVQIMAYELRMGLSEKPAFICANNLPADFNETEALYAHLEALMIDSDFLDPQKPKLLMQRIRRLFARARLEKEEVQILRGILSALVKHSK